MNRIKQSGGWLMLVCLLVACGGVQTTSVPTIVPASALQSTNLRQVDLADQGTIGLSPNGAWLITSKQAQLCVVATDTLLEKTCVEAKYVDFPTLAWSPDSRRVAWTEDWAKRAVDSDIWVLEVASGKLTNLTDDGFAGTMVQAVDTNAQITVDVAPAWSPDGASLVFARTPADRGSTNLYRVAATGGPPEQIALVTPGYGLAIYRGVFVHADGSIIYTIAHGDTSYERNGVWRINADGSNPQQLVANKPFSTDSPQKGVPIVADVNFSHALLYWIKSTSRFFPSPNVSLYSLLDLQTGTVTPLKQVAEPSVLQTISFVGPTAATFSPDGGKILYTYRTADFRPLLAVRDLASDHEYALQTFESPETAIVGDPNGTGLNWASNNLVYGSSVAPNGMLLQLSTK